MNTEWKGAKLKNFKLQEESGFFKALFCRFNDIDKQGDLTLRGAFGTQRVIISSYGHGSWTGALPVGKGVIHDGEEGGIVEGQFFLNTTDGKEAYTIVKELGDLQEWSYALPVVDFEMRTIDGQSVRVLKHITVQEVSPVLRGAGNGTRTLAIKGYYAGRQAEDLAQAERAQKVATLFSDIERLVKYRYVEIGAGQLQPAVRSAAWATRDVIWRRQGEPWPLAIVFLREEHDVVKSAFDKVHEVGQRVRGWAHNLADKIYLESPDADPRDVPYTVAHEIRHLLSPVGLAKDKEEADADYFARYSVGAFASDIKALAASYLKD